MKSLDLGVQNFGVWFALLPEKTLEVNVAALSKRDEGLVKCEFITVEVGRKEMEAEVGIQSCIFGKCGNGLNFCVEVLQISNNVKYDEKRQEQLGAGAVIVTFSKCLKKTNKSTASTIS